MHFHSFHSFIYCKHLLRCLFSARIVQYILYPAICNQLLFTHRLLPGQFTHPWKSWMRPRLQRQQPGNSAFSKERVYVTRRQRINAAATTEAAISWRSDERSGYEPGVQRWKIVIRRQRPPAALRSAVCRRPTFARTTNILYQSGITADGGKHIT